MTVATLPHFVRLSLSSSQVQECLNETREKSEEDRRKNERIERKHLPVTSTTSIERTTNQCIEYRVIFGFGLFLLACVLLTSLSIWTNLLSVVLQHRPLLSHLCFKSWITSSDTHLLLSYYNYTYNHTHTQTNVVIQRSNSSTAITITTSHSSFDHKRIYGEKIWRVRLREIICFASKWRRRFVHKSNWAHQSKWQTNTPSLIIVSSLSPPLCSP